MLLIWPLILFFEVKLKFFWRQTDRPTPQGIEAPSRSLKIINRNFKFQSSRLEQNHIVLRNENSDQKYDLPKRLV